MITVVELRDLTQARARKLYAELVQRLKPDTHRNMLAEAKTFGRWLVKERQLQVNPFEAIEPIGRRSHGKPQLRIDEAARVLPSSARPGISW